MNIHFPPIFQWFTFSYLYFCKIISFLHFCLGSFSFYSKDVCAQSLQSCTTLCDPIDDSLPGSSDHGILQARILEWVAMPSSMGSSQPRDQTCMSCLSSALAVGLFTTSATRGAHSKDAANYSLTIYLTISLFNDYFWKIFSLVIWF